MNKEQKDILNRVKLFMNYDNKKTLSENYQSILNEQPTASVTDRQNYPIQAALWLNKNVDSWGTKIYSDTYENYLLNIKDLPLQNLLDISKQLAENGYGPMTKGLYGANDPNPSLANIPLENLIYFKKKQNYEKEKAEYQKNPRNKLKPELPAEPVYTYISPMLFAAVSILMGDEKNTPQIILSNIEQNREKKKQENILPDTPFRNKEQSDQFRLWLLTNYPEYEKKPKPYNVQLISNSINSEALKKAYKEKGKEYEKQKTGVKNNQVDLRYRPELERRDNTDTNVGKNFQQPIFDEEKYDKEENKKYFDEVLSKYDFTTFPFALKVDSYLGKDIPKYEEDYWIEPNTKEKFYIQGKTLEQLKLEIFKGLEYSEKLKYEDELLNNDLLVKIFGESTISAAMNRTECDQESTLAFFQEVLDGKHKINGKIVGKHVRGKNGPEFVYWPKNEKIPCIKLWWNDNGWWVQLGGMLLVSMITPQLGLPRVAAILIELAADTSLNLYSLKQNMDAKDKGAMKLDIVYILLPFVFQTPVMKNLVKRLKFGDATIKSVESKFKSLPKKATKKQVNLLISQMTPEEKRLVSILGEENYANEIRIIGEEALNIATKGATASISRKLAEPLFTILYYGLPAAGYGLNQYKQAMKILEENGETPTQTERKAWELIIHKTEELDLNFQNEELIMLINNMREKKELEQKIEEEKINKDEKILNDIESILNDIMNTLETLEKTTKD